MVLIKKTEVENLDRQLLNELNSDHCPIRYHIVNGLQIRHIHNIIEKLPSGNPYNKSFYIA